LNSLQHLLLSKESNTLKNILLQDGVDNKFSNILEKDIIQKNSNANIKIKIKKKSYFEQYKNETINNKIPISLQILFMEEVPQSNICKNLYNNHVVQDPKCLINQTYEKNETNYQDKKQIMDNNNEQIHSMSPLEANIVNNFLQDLDKEHKIINEDSNSFEQSISLLNMEAISCIKDENKITHKQHNDLEEVDTKNSYKEINIIDIKHSNRDDDKNFTQCIQDDKNEVKTKETNCKISQNEIHEKNDDQVQIDFLEPLQNIARKTLLSDLLEGENQSFDAIHDEQLLDNKHPIQSLNNKKIQEIFPSNKIAKTNEINELSKSIIKNKKEKYFEDLGPMIPNLILEKSTILQTQDCSSLISMVNLEGIASNKHPIQSLQNKNLQELIPSNLIIKAHDINEFQYSMNGNKGDKCVKVFESIIPDANLDKSRILHTQGCLSFMSMVDLEGITTNTITRESQHNSTKEFGIEIKDDLNPKHEKIIDTNFHIKEHNALKQKKLYQDHKLEACVFETNLHVLQCFTKDPQSISKLSNGCNDQIDQSKANNELECIISKDLQNNNDNELNKFLVVNCNKEKIDPSECVNLLTLDMEPCILKRDQEVCRKVNNKAIMDNKTYAVRHLQMKESQNKNASKMPSFKNQNQSRDLVMDCVNKLIPLPNSPQIEKTKFLHNSIKNINEIFSSIEPYSLLNQKENCNDDDLFATKTVDKVIYKYNDTTSDGCESSISENYSLTPEDGGILRNKKSMIDDVIQNENSIPSKINEKSFKLQSYEKSFKLQSYEKSFKLQSYEKSLNSLSQKACTYKKLYNMKRTCNEHNSLKTSIPPHTPSSHAPQYNARVHSTKVDSLYPCNPYPFSKQDSNDYFFGKPYPYNSYPHKINDFEVKKFNSRTKGVESKFVDESIKNKFQRHDVSQPLNKVKRETISSPRQDMHLNSNGAHNNGSLSKFTKSKSSLQYSKKCQFIEEDKVFFEFEKIQFLHNEHEDAKNEIFVPFVFDDARFVMPSKHCSIEASNSSRTSCHEEQERISSNLKRKKVITPENCIISSNCLQCQQTPTGLPMANLNFALQNDSDSVNHKDCKDQQECHHKVIKLCHFAKDKSEERNEGNINPQITACEGMKTKASIETEQSVIRGKTKGNSSHINEKYHTKEGYGKPCCCDPFQGHATTCYQYVPNYEPPEVTKIKKSSNLDDLRMHIKYDEKCHKKFIASRKAQLSILDYGDQFEHQFNKLQKAHKYGSSQLQSCKNVDEGNASLELRLSKKSNVHDHVEKDCEYDRIGRYRRKSEFPKPKLRQHWKKQ
jgi:hypothetical protein